MFKYVREDFESFRDISLPDQLEIFPFRNYDFFSFAIFQNRKNVTSNHNHHNNSWIVILFKQNLFIINQFEITYCFFGRFGSSYAHFGFWVKINFWQFVSQLVKNKLTFLKKSNSCPIDIFSITLHFCFVHTVSLNFNLGLGSSWVWVRRDRLSETLKWTDSDNVEIFDTKSDH